MLPRIQGFLPGQHELLKPRSPPCKAYAALLLFCTVPISFGNTSFTSCFLFTLPMAFLGISCTIAALRGT